MVTLPVWLLIALPLGAEATSVAWDAHLGGFVAGFGFMIASLNQ